MLVNLGGLKNTWEIVDRFLDAAGGLRFAVGSILGIPVPSTGSLSALGPRPGCFPPSPAGTTPASASSWTRCGTGLHSWTRRVDGEVRHRVVPVVRTWAERRFGSLHAALEPDLEIVWRAYDLP